MIEMLVDAAPGDALLGCVSVLRRLGGRIIRYDVEEQTLEARLPGWRYFTTVHLSAEPAAEGRARLRLDDEGLGWWRRRRLRAELGRVPTPPLLEGEDER